MVQAVVASVLVMAGIFGAPPGQCGCVDSPAVVQQQCKSATIGGRTRGGMSPTGTLWSPVTSNGTVTYDVGPLGRPRYSPLWLIHSNATFYPGNYAKPYDYREAFGYPWNGPRPLATQPIPSQFISSPPSLPGPWPDATAAAYIRQSQPRVASKPVLATP
jgi:hypothetical protein